MTRASDICGDPTIVHRIVNLTLLPLDDNQALSNRDWSDKQFLYQALGAEDPQTAKHELAGDIERRII